MRDGAIHSTIAGGVPLGSYGRGTSDWEIPLFHPSGSNFRVRITAFRRLSDYPWYAEVIDESNAPFTITDSGKIAFVRSIYEPASNTDIYVIDTGGERRLTTNPRQDVDPAWSADWPMIAFTSYRDGNPEIYVMRADGTNKRRLTNDPAADTHPTWSPDGTRLAFCTERDGNREIYVMNADGTYPRRLTTNPAFDIEPAWSPDGAKLAFVSGRDANYEIYVMNADGTDQRRLTTNPAEDNHPTWSPDGTKIAFYTYRDGNAEICVMNSDASYKTNLTTSSVTPDWDPSWTPARSYRIRHPLTPVPLLAPPRP
ncbi:PD40 domain-containing protein [Candidatus Bipolaricaulota bacterium]|nr:PD40 domain-containing protein [Candidatus Bipolaricaulota bacterium]